ncbi:MAG: helix-turn-helix domain-containing protein [Lachnospiraceae bacterium]
MMSPFQFHLKDFDNYHQLYYINRGGLSHSESYHQHDFTELTIITGGTGVHLIEGKRYHLSEGEVYAVIPSFKHRVIDVQYITHYNIMFDYNKLVAFRPELKHIPGFQEFFISQPYNRFRHKFLSHLTLTPEQLSFVSSLCEIIIEHTEKNSRTLSHSAINYLVCLLTYLSDLYIPSSDKTFTQFQQIDQTVAYIEEHYMEPIRIPDLSKMAFLSERQYARIFKQVYQITPNEYIIRCRFDHALALIEQTNFSIAQIAEQCGFADSSTFNKQFKARYGMSPGQYRMKPTNES